MTRISFLSKPSNWFHWHPFITYGVVFGLFLFIAFFNLDPDFGWHLRAGEYFVAHGFPATDIFTYTASNFPWVSHEWLHDILTYFLYSVGGYPLLSVFFALLWTGAIWVVTRKMPTPLVLIAVLALLPFAGVRTLTWSVVLLVALMSLVQYKKGRFSFLIPLLLLLWANLHGSFVVGFAYLGYQSIKQKSLKLAVITLISIAVTFINPYGYHVYGEIFTTLGDSSLRGRIQEWRSFFIPPIAFAYVIAWLAVTAYGMKSVWRDWRSYVRIDILFFAASMLQLRHLPLFIVVSLPFTARGIAKIIALIPKNLDVQRRRFVSIVATLFTLATIGTVFWTYPHISLDREAPYPAHAAVYLQRNGCDGNVFNDYNYGGYLIWKVPNEKVYIDGRMPSWSYKGEKYLDNYAKFLGEEQYRNEQIKKYSITCIVIAKKQTEMIKSLEKTGWKVTVTDNNSVLLLKSKDN